MAKFQMGVTLNTDANITARVADGTGAANQLDKADNGKFVKLVGDSQYGLCAVGNEIEGILAVANDIAPADGFNLGSVTLADDSVRVAVTLDGLQATPGTGTIAVGDYVVCGTVVARGTALSGNPKVCKATAAATGIVYKWRLVAILNGGNGAVGNTGIIQAVC